MSAIIWRALVVAAVLILPAMALAQDDDDGQLGPNAYGDAWGKSSDAERAAFAHAVALIMIDRAREIPGASSDLAKVLAALHACLDRNLRSKRPEDQTVVMLLRTRPLKDTVQMCANVALLTK
ncbi:MAG TPA: hypothetical protein PK264_24520 [Hyphomicrobiaceae bacterium]|nr:hypothetical protein [Hyphomicrobiaceae bacterium]